MPKALFILEWDVLEGAIVTMTVPADAEINPADVQTIEVAHQFNPESAWITIEDSSFKAASVFNHEVQKALVLVLNPEEVASTYTKFLVELASFILPRAGRPDTLERMTGAFSMIQAEVPITDVVILNLAKRIEMLEGEKLDMKERIEAIIGLCEDAAVKVLLWLVAREGSSSVEAIGSMLGKDTTVVDEIVDALVERGLVVRNEREGSVALVHGFDQALHRGKPG